MKTSSQLVMAFLALALVVACGKKKDNDQAQVEAARGVRGGTEGAAGGSTLPSGQAYNPGPGVAVYVDDQSAATFDNAVKLLVSATVDPQQVGHVDNRAGVIMQGEVLIDRNTGRLNTANSKIQLTITDDMTDANGNRYEPIVIKVLGTSGTAMNGTANLVFSDSYGSINISGTYDSTTFRGNVSFQNTGKQMTSLGRFEIPVCNFFNCQ